MGCAKTWVAPLVWSLTVLIVGVIGWASGHHPEALWSPGHLSRYHTDIRTCHSCHEPFLGPIPSKCQSCHSLANFEKRAELEVTRFHQQILSKQESCLFCHTEHQGILAAITMGMLNNPHGEFIFRVTKATSCSDCHQTGSKENRKTVEVLDNSIVAHLIEEGEGAHRLGHFAKCLNCHRGGQLEIDEHEDNDEKVEEDD